MYMYERGLLMMIGAALGFTGYFPDSGTITGKSIKGVKCLCSADKRTGSCDRYRLSQGRVQESLVGWDQ